MMLTYKKKTMSQVGVQKLGMSVFFTTAVVHGSLKKLKEREKGNLQAVISKYRAAFKATTRVNHWVKR